MTNNRQCPVCRSPLASSNCKKCGYQQKKLKIVETQEQFGRFNFINRVQRTQTAQKNVKSLTSQEKLKLYLRQYIKLLKSATTKVALAYSLSPQLSQRLIDTVFSIWKGYLLKRQEMGMAVVGMFKRYISTKIRTSNNKKKKSDAAEQRLSDGRSEKDLDSSQEEREETTKKRPAEGSQGPGQGEVQKKELQLKHKFRSYYIVSVKPLIQESIEQRKTDPKGLTSCQKSFLSYLLAASDVDEDFARMCSHRYLRMILRLGGKGNEGSYVKDSEITKQLKMRNCGTLDKKEDCILVIMLIDLLWCFDSQSFHMPSNQKLSDLLSLYEQCEIKSEIIDIIVESFNKSDVQASPNVPDITFQLIYTIIYLAATKIGACLTISQIIHGCGSLQIAAINIQQQIFIEGVNNEQAINPTKIRKNSNLLANFLDIKGQLLLSKWCHKWCTKLQLKNSVNHISIVCELIFKQLLLNQPRGDGRGEFFAEGKVIKYKRHFWIEQDIACLAAIVIYVKLATGVTNYPYIVNLHIKEIAQAYNIEDNEMNFLSELLNNRSIKVFNTSTNLLKMVVFPQIYNNHISLLTLSKTITQLSLKDKAYSSHSFNKNAIRFRNMSHLDGMGCNQLIARFTQIKEANTKSQQNKQYEIQLKYQEMLHKQFTRELAQRYKKIRSKKKQEPLAKHNAKQNINIIRQMECIIKDNDKLVKEGQPILTQQCMVDEPSSNYELLYEYNQQNLTLSCRTQQLYLMQALCLNLCTFSQLTYWLNREEYLLKFFET